MLTAAAFPYALSLPPDAVLEADGEGGTRVRAAARAAGLGPLTPAAEAALAGLLGPPIRQEALIARLHQSDPAGMLAMLDALARLAQAGLLRRSVPGPEGAPLATLAPLRAGFEAEHRPAGPDETFRLARFARLVQGDIGLSLESPLAMARVDLPDRRAAALVPALAEGLSLRRIAQELPALDPQTTGLVAGLMRSAGLLEARGEAPAAPAAPAAEGWEAADLEFHVHSRRGFRDARVGATYPGGREGPPPRAPFLGTATELPQPDAAALAASDPPFAKVLDGRRSTRRFGAAPVALPRIGELLHRAARARTPEEGRGRAPGGQRGGLRPYPSGGGGYELETYLVAERCAGLAPGLHRFDPDAGRLHLVRPRDARTTRLLEDAARSAGEDAPPPLLIVLSARFGRVQWKYERLAYALILKNVGVAMQTFALSAETMGLAACVLGGGDSALFAEAAGTDPFEESSVGEIMIGERDAGETP